MKQSFAAAVGYFILGITVGQLFSDAIPRRHPGRRVERRRDRYSDRLVRADVAVADQLAMVGRADSAGPALGHAAAGATGCERNNLRAWLRPASALIVTPRAVLVAVPLYRVYTVPEVDPGFWPEEFAVPWQRTNHLLVIRR